MSQPMHDSTPWHAKYPAPIEQNPRAISRDEVLHLLKRSPVNEQRDFVLVDLRRADHEGGFIRGSLNLPAQSLYPSIPTLYSLFRVGGIKKVIWFCGSSRGRGPRAAGWFSDHLGEVGDQTMESLVLQDGIRGWVAAGGEFLDWVDEYDASVWST